jgi:ribonuclease BN (tRNA processing enzyme)
MSASSRLRVRLLPSAVSGDPEQQYATSFLVNGSIAIDAGSVGFHATPAEQDRVRHVLLTHSHADHVASLPILVENTLRAEGPPLEIWGSAETLSSLRQDLFNDRVWPSLARLETAAGPAASLRQLEPERTIEIDGVHVTPVAVDHSVPALGFVLERAGVAVAISGDTGPTERLWQLARASKSLAAVFLEVAYPDELAELARAAFHHTPTSFAAELDKLPRGVPVIAVHLKPRYRARLLAQLAALERPEVAIGSPSREYAW